jgi:hypothetical protein
MAACGFSRADGSNDSTRSGDGIVPLEPFEPRKISISRLQNTIMFNGQSGKVRIRHEIPDGFAIAKHPLKNHPMVLSRMN